MSDKITMPADATIELTAEELALMKRAAFEAGSKHGRVCGAIGMTRVATEIDSKNSAREEYPIRRKVPRVVKDDSGLSYRVMDDEVQRMALSGEWVWLSDSAFAATPERIRLWADLLDNPYDEAAR